ncbi:hypothetical protein [uncultured Desulfobulbus sp.]|uniref:hypothetical protein n=1 Tax=uncultured Desulfobulbus sp. TaxID=239745 RepID=UPI0029C8522B|nr:hypothetical protein [uncultured Desulfobulbus sp.]
MINELSPDEYLQMVACIADGKKMPDAIYMHKSIYLNQNEKLIKFINFKIKLLSDDKLLWNIIKIFKYEFKISLLHYPDFFSMAYPELHTSFVYNFLKNTLRSFNYKKSSNPPILHRKEMFLSKDHPLVPLFKELTREGEQAGLYDNSKFIGFKKNWSNIIAERGYKLEDGHIVVAK